VIAFIAGLFIGAALGMLTAALCVISKTDD
jgi:hypothetical protein